jgi:hypothetical protein
VSFFAQRGLPSATVVLVIHPPRARRVDHDHVAAVGEEHALARLVPSSIRGGTFFLSRR